ncbi:MAG TPA: DNA-formamidopyrimidine glycosylase family protein, partial [Acidimicrobiia bacterium]|nr:DNA-formamidopyrimidine glycosylase family protein [Acidimicrobiia bacterium]
MPEGDTIFRAAAQLRAALVGKHLVELELRRDPRGLRGPDPGTVIAAVESNGKHLLVHFADRHVLHTHMQMTGVWHVYGPNERWRRPGHTARVVVRVDDGTTAVCFSAPTVELRREHDGRDRPTRASRMLDRLGPDLCESGLDLDTVLTRLASLDPGTELAAALLDQRVAAGIGNVFKSEICWAERVFPFTPVGDLDQATRRRIYETARFQ